MLKLSKRQSLADLVQQALRNSKEIRPFPAAVTQLVAACQDSNANPATFEKIIECDPGLAVRLLRIANSPLYGLNTGVQTIGHATSVLGIRQIRNLALSVAGSAMFSSGSTAAKSRKLLWDHSLGCATVSRLLGDALPSVSADETFLAGVFHDVGKLLFFDVVPEGYENLVSDCGIDELVDEENAVFRMNHQEVGLQSAQSWGLSENIKMAIGYHHRPHESPAHQDFVTVVDTANRLALAWGVGSKCLVDPDQTERDASERLGLDIETLTGLRGQAAEVFVETSSAIGD